MSGAPPTQRITRREDLATIAFTEEGMAAVMAPAELLGEIAFKNDSREESPRLAAVRGSIELNGYDPTQPIIVRVGQKGKWVVVDGGHRLTAVRQICGSWWKRIFSKRIGDLYFLLFLTPRSYAKEPGLRPPGACAPKPPTPPDAARPASARDPRRAGSRPDLPAGAVAGSPRIPSSSLRNPAQAR